jgi:hypothetical protein
MASARRTRVRNMSRKPPTRCAKAPSTTYPDSFYLLAFRVSDRRLLWDENPGQSRRDIYNMQR